jgi:hypothetical protein
VSVAVTEVNDAPVAAGESYTKIEDGSLTGGAGSDRIVGSAGNDVLIAADIACQSTRDALWAILADWIAGKSEDAAAEADEELAVMSDSDVDKLTGSSGADLFFIGFNDVITDINGSKNDGDIVIRQWVLACLDSWDRSQSRSSCRRRPQRRRRHDEGGQRTLILTAANSFAGNIDRQKDKARIERDVLKYYEGLALQIRCICVKCNASFMVRPGRATSHPRFRFLINNRRQAYCVCRLGYVALIRPIRRFLCKILCNCATPPPAITWARNNVSSEQVVEMAEPTRVESLR